MGYRCAIEGCDFSSSSLEVFPDHYVGHGRSSSVPYWVWNDEGQRVDYGLESVRLPGVPRAAKEEIEAQLGGALAPPPWDPSRQSALKEQAYLARQDYADRSYLKHNQSLRAVPIMYLDSGFSGKIPLSRSYSLWIRKQDKYRLFGNPSSPEIRAIDTLSPARTDRERATDALRPDVWFCETALMAVRFGDADYLRHFTRWHAKLPTGGCVTVPNFVHPNFRAPLREPCCECDRYDEFLHRVSGKLYCATCCPVHILRYSDAVAAAVNPLARSIHSPRQPQSKTWREKSCVNPIRRIRGIALAIQGGTWGTGGNLRQLEFVLNAGISDEDGPIQADYVPIDPVWRSGQSLSAGEPRKIPTESEALRLMRANGATEDVLTYAKARYLEEHLEKDLPAVLGEGWDTPRVKKVAKQIERLKNAWGIAGGLVGDFQEYYEKRADAQWRPCQSPAARLRRIGKDNDDRKCPYYFDYPTCNSFTWESRILYSQVPGWAAWRESIIEGCGPRASDLRLFLSAEDLQFLDEGWSEVVRTVEPQLNRSERVYHLVPKTEIRQHELVDWGDIRNTTPVCGTPFIVRNIIAGQCEARFRFLETNLLVLGFRARSGAVAWVVGDPRTNTPDAAWAEPPGEHSSVQPNRDAEQAVNANGTEVEPFPAQGKKRGRPFDIYGQHEMPSHQICEYRFRVWEIRFDGKDGKSRPAYYQHAKLEGDRSLYYPTLTQAHIGFRDWDVWTIDDDNVQRPAYKTSAGIARIVSTDEWKRIDGGRLLLTWNPRGLRDGFGVWISRQNLLPGQSLNGTRIIEKTQIDPGVYRYITPGTRHEGQGGKESRTSNSGRRDLFDELTRVSSAFEKPQSGISEYLKAETPDDGHVQEGEEDGGNRKRSDRLRVTWQPPRLTRQCTAGALHSDYQFRFPPLSKREFGSRVPLAVPGPITKRVIESRPPDQPLPPEIRPWSEERWHEYWFQGADRCPDVDDGVRLPKFTESTLNQRCYRPLTRQSSEQTENDHRYNGYSPLTCVDIPTRHLRANPRISTPRPYHPIGAFSPWHLPEGNGAGGQSRPRWFKRVVVPVRDGFT